MESLPYNPDTLRPPLESYLTLYYYNTSAPGKQEKSLIFQGKSRLFLIKGIWFLVRELIIQEVHIKCELPKTFP